MVLRRINSGARAAVGSNALRVAFTVLQVSATLMLAGLLAPIAHSQSVNREIEAASVSELKQMYLSCDRAAMEGLLDNAMIMQCSVVYEMLKLRAFGGDFDKLLVWSMAHPYARNARK